MGNNVAYKVASIRTIIIKMFDKIVIILIDIKHVPKLKNLIFLSRLEYFGFSFKVEGGALQVYKNALVVMKGKCWCKFLLTTNMSTTCLGGLVKDILHRFAISGLLSNLRQGIYIWSDVVLQEGWY